MGRAMGRATWMSWRGRGGGAGDGWVAGRRERGREGEYFKRRIRRRNVWPKAHRGSRRRLVVPLRSRYRSLTLKFKETDNGFSERGFYNIIFRFFPFIVWAKACTNNKRLLPRRCVARLNRSRE
jgi:hypothetical protein